MWKTLEDRRRKAVKTQSILVALLQRCKKVRQVKNTFQREKLS
jgi:hypothetical protein